MPTDYLTQLYTDVRAIMAATWTDVPPGGIWEDEHAEMVPWSTLQPPYGVICLDRAPIDTDGEWGTANNVFDLDLGLYYVGLIAGDSSSIRAKLESLRQALLTGSITNGQVVDIRDLCWSDTLPANNVFMTKDYTHRAGRLVVNVIVGETQ